MNLEEFLTLRGTDLPAVVAAVEAKFNLDAADLVLAVGSLVEGLGNSKSDVDLLLVTPRDAGELGVTGDVTVVVDRCLVDVRVLPLAEARALLDRFAGWAQRPWDVTHSAKFAIDERTLLHRLHHGAPLYQGDRCTVIERLPSQLDLARLKLHVARQNSRTIQVDMVGYREVGDHRSLVFAAQELLCQAVDALVAGYGLTNPLTKWRSRLLDLLPADWASGLMIRPTGHTAGEHVWRLHRAPEWPDEATALRHALAISAFTRAVFVWADLRLLGGSGQAQRASWDAVQRHEQDTALPFLDFDVDFALTRDGAMIARLNEFGRPLGLSPAEFALVLLFDGTTTAREAAAAVHGTGAVEPGAVTRLVAQVRDAGFCAPYPEGTR
jgi:predicted nucleotidyltransferase